MTSDKPGSVEADWTRLGMLFNCAPAQHTPDLERLLLETARRAPGNARLLPLSVTWLSAYGACVARHRLRRLVESELEPEHQPALGLILSAAVDHGASRDLLLAAEVCRPASPERPLFDVHAEEPLRSLARSTASPAALAWGLWIPEIAVKPEALRPIDWILRENPSCRDRIIRKGDLRVSILESLRHDTAHGVAASESQLARLAGANRSAVRKALEALELEGAVAIEVGGRDHPVRLLAA